MVEQPNSSLKPLPLRGNDWLVLALGKGGQLEIMRCIVRVIEQSLLSSKRAWERHDSVKVARSYRNMRERALQVGSGWLGSQ